MRLIDADILIEKIGIGKDCNECQHSERKLYCNWKPDVVDICEAICTAQTIEPEPHWIPCSERLPGTEDCPMDCLVTRKSKFIGNYTDMAVCEKNGTWTHEDWDAIVLGDVENGKATGLVSTRDDNIIAWMPLPEPYQGEGEQE